MHNYLLGNNLQRYKVGNLYNFYIIFKLSPIKRLKILYLDSIT